RPLYILVRKSCVRRIRLEEISPELAGRRASGWPRTGAQGTPTRLPRWGPRRSGAEASAVTSAVRRAPRGPRRAFSSAVGWLEWAGRGQDPIALWPHQRAPDKTLRAPTSTATFSCCGVSVPAHDDFVVAFQHRRATA